MPVKMAAVSPGPCFWDVSPLNSFTEKQNVRILGVGISFIVSSIVSAILDT